MTILRPSLGADFDQLLNVKIGEDNARPLLPDLPKPDEELIKLKPKAVIGDVLNPPEEFGDPILSFTPPYGWLHNDYPAEVSAMGFKFKCVSDAFRIAEEKVKPNDPHWDSVTQFTIMRMLVEQKFTVDEGLKFMLLGTKKRHLEYVNDTDTLWGTDISEPLHPMIAEITGMTYNGRNELGKMLMEVRKLIRVGMAGLSEVIK